MSATMTRSERTDLATLVRQRERLLKTLAAQRSAELMADVEAQLARIYHFDEDDTWAAAEEAAEEAMKEAQTEIAERSGMTEQAFETMISGEGIKVLMNL